MSESAQTARQKWETAVKSVLDRIENGGVASQDKEWAEAYSLLISAPPFKIDN
ncbi:hypothetical protein [Rhodococcus sovatensis]|uniref:PH domain-containing protein n=1 Tax=Rhodococcus sovatensis TaxID=1805840 RepID=A0ABZ2PP06_9NOCA